MDENAQSTTSTGIQDYYNLIKAEHEANNAWSAEQAQKAMDYQTQMSNSAHQREVADLKAAGLNPVLSAGGSGASSGSGIAAQRGDENVTALYGLTKTALDATLKQASAMNNFARAYGSGSSASTSSSAYGFNFGSDVGNAVFDALADFLYRRFGIKQSTTAAVVNAVDKALPPTDGVNNPILRFVLTDTPGYGITRSFQKKIVEKAREELSHKPVVVYHGRTVHVTGSAKGLNSSYSIPSKIINTVFPFIRSYTRS